MSGSYIWKGWRKRESQHQHWSWSSGARFLDLGIAMGKFDTAADQRVGYVGERDSVLAAPERWGVTRRDKGALQGRWISLLRRSGLDTEVG